MTAKEKLLTKAQSAALENFRLGWSLIHRLRGRDEWRDNTGRVRYLRAPRYSTVRALENFGFLRRDNAEGFHGAYYSLREV